MQGRSEKEKTQSGEVYQLVKGYQENDILQS